MNAIRAAEHVVWILMPGNHDHANATELWRQVNGAPVVGEQPVALDGEVLVVCGTETVLSARSAAAERAESVRQTGRQPWLKGAEHRVNRN